MAISDDPDGIIKLILVKMQDQDVFTFKLQNCFAFIFKFQFVFMNDVTEHCQSNTSIYLAP